MALFVQKPIFWNANNYKAPSGAKATSGYPAEKGYGHEEWNNSDKLLLTDNKQTYRIFHTEGLGNAPVAENAGQTFIFMTAAHDGVQQLVGVAGNAMSIIGPEFKKERLRIAKLLGLNSLWVETWAVPSVRSKHHDDKTAFRMKWDDSLHWLPNWICPSDFFLWFESPVTIDAQSLMEKEKLLDRFGSYTNLDRAIATRFLKQVPKRQRNKHWENILDAVGSSPDGPVERTSNDEDEVSVTSTLSQVNSRRGQGKFRADLIAKWNGACAVSSLSHSAILRASHIKPWAKSNNRERLDPDNGLLLSANLDALFDKGLISFANDGRMLVSSQLDAAHRTALFTQNKLRFPPTDKQIQYLDYHRKKRFEK